METTRYLIVPLLQAFCWFDDGLQAFLQKRGWAHITRPQSMVMVNVLTGVDKQVVTGYALAGTPRTLVVGADGRIECNILGAWRGILEHRIEAACGQSAVREGKSS